MALFSIQKRFVSQAFRKFCYNLSGFNKYGLMRDDVINEYDEDVEEALKRLPQNIKDARTFRILRAVQLDIEKSILPKAQWTQFEQDEMYLQPYIKQVIKEREEREEWEQNH